MNLKPINEVPEIESLQEGDKILINSNGAAKQVAASKVGGLPTGGEPHQQLVTDKDGNTMWEDKLCYTEQIQSEVLPETELMAMGGVEGQFMLLTPPTTTPVEGVNHTVVYNGTTYECVAVEVSDDGLTGIALGNTGRFSGEPDPAGPPFILMFANAFGEGIYGMGVALNGSETFTISVNINDESVKKIEPKFMPSGTIYGRVEEFANDNVLTAYANKAMTKQVTFAEGVKMLEEYGLRVCISLDEGLQTAFGGTHMYAVPKSACVQNENKAILVTLGVEFNGSEGMYIWFSDTVEPT